MDIGAGITFGAGVAITPEPPAGNKVIFGYGLTVINNSWVGLSMTNLVTPAGVVGNDVTGVGTARGALAAAGYGTDKAIFGYGSTNAGSEGVVSITNKVSNTGVVATDTTGVGTLRWQLAAACYGTDKAIFGYGYINALGNIYTAVTNKVSNTGVVATDTAGVGTSRYGLAAAGYGSSGQAIFGYGIDGSVGPVSMTNKVSNTGVVSSDTTGVGSTRSALAATGYGNDKAMFAFGYNGGTGGFKSMINLVSNTGVVATDTSTVATARFNVVGAVYGTDKAIISIGSGGFVTNLVSNTGVVASDIAGVGTDRAFIAGAAYG